MEYKQIIKYKIEMNLLKVKNNELILTKDGISKEMIFRKNEMLLHKVNSLIERLKDN